MYEPSSDMYRQPGGLHQPRPPQNHPQTGLNLPADFQQQLQRQQDPSLGTLTQQFPPGFNGQQQQLLQRQLQQQQQQQQQPHQGQQLLNHGQPQQAGQRTMPPAGMNPFNRIPQSSAAAASQQRQLNAMAMGDGIPGFPIGGGAGPSGVPGSGVGGQMGIRAAGPNAGMPGTVMGGLGMVGNMGGNMAGAMGGMNAGGALGVGANGMNITIPPGQQRQPGVGVGVANLGGNPINMGGQNRPNGANPGMQQRTVSGSHIFGGQSAGPAGVFNPANIGMSIPAGAAGAMGAQGMMGGAANQANQLQAAGNVPGMGVHPNQQTMQLMGGQQHPQQQQQQQQPQQQGGPPGSNMQQPQQGAGQPRPPSVIGNSAFQQPPNNPSPGRPPSTAAQHQYPNQMGRTQAGIVSHMGGMGAMPGMLTGPGSSPSRGSPAQPGQPGNNAPGGPGHPMGMQMIPQQNTGNQRTPMMAQARPPSRPQQGGPLGQQPQQQGPPFGPQGGRVPTPQMNNQLQQQRMMQPGQQQPGQQFGNQDMSGIAPNLTGGGPQPQAQGHPANLIATPSQQAARVESYATNLPHPPGPGNLNPAALGNQPLPGSNGLPFGPVGGALSNIPSATGGPSPTNNILSATNSQLGGQGPPGQQGMQQPMGIQMGLGRPMQGQPGQPGQQQQHGGMPRPQQQPQQQQQQPGMPHPPQQQRPGPGGQMMAGGVPGGVPSAPPGSMQQQQPGQQPGQQPQNPGLPQPGGPHPPPPGGPVGQQGVPPPPNRMPPQPQRTQSMIRGESVGAGNPGTPGSVGGPGTDGSTPGPVVVGAPGGPPGANRGMMMAAVPYKMSHGYNIGSGQGVIRMLEFSSMMASGHAQPLQYWEAVVDDFFVPKKGCMRMTLTKDDAEVKPFEIFTPTLPRFFFSSFCSGAISIHITLNGVRESCTAPGEGIVESNNASFTYTFETGYVVVLTGHLRAHIYVVPNQATQGTDGPSQPHPGQGPPGPGPSLKFNFIDFTSKKVSKSIDPTFVKGPRMPFPFTATGLWGDGESPMGMMNGMMGGDTPINGLVNGHESTGSGASSSPTMVSGSRTASSAGTTMGGQQERGWVIERAFLPAEPVNAFGIPESTMRVLELAESVTHLGDLISLSLDQKIGPIQSLDQYATRVRQKNPEEFYGRNEHMQGVKPEPLDFQLSHFNNGHLAGGMIPNGMVSFTPGLMMTASPGMMHINGPGGPNPMPTLVGPPPGMMPPPPTTPQVDAHTPGGPGVTPRLNHPQNPMNQSPGMRPNSSSGPPGSSAHGTPSMSFNGPPPGNKRKATLEGGPDGSGLGPGDGQGPPQRRQRTSGPGPSGNNPGFGPGPGDGGGESPSEGMNTRGRGRKSPVQTKATPLPQAKKNNNPRRATGGN